VKNAPIILAGFGASTMRGWRPGLHPFETFRALFERDLAELGIPAVFTDAAQPGNTVLGGQQRFERDVLLQKRDAVMINFGGNDSAPHPEDPSRNRVGLETYREVHELWCRTLEKAGTPFALITCQKFATADEAARNRRLLPYVETIRKLAAERKVPLIDTYARLEQLQSEGLDLAEIYLDGMHFNVRGHRLMADFLLEFEKQTGFFAGVHNHKR